METTRILPDDILEEILVRVPVKSLLTWKCVCKRWYSLFRDYDFTLKHYRFQYALHIAHHGTLPLFLDRSSSYPGPEEERTEFLVLSKCGGDDVLLNVTPDFHRDIPPTFDNDYQLELTFSCLGIVNGVIGLQWGRTCLALWNPATREFKEVPRWPIMPDNKGAEEFGGKVLGLGFDQQSQDFKILGQIDFYGAGIEPNVFEYHLYSLKANSWKKVEKQPRSDHDFDYSITDAYLNNGVYYWHALDKATMDIYNTSVIVAFNFNTELFTEFELPMDRDCHNREHKRTTDGLVCLDCSFSLTIGKYKETLSLFISHTMKNPDESDGYVEIWVVTRFREDDHGVPLSWHLAVRVSHIPSCIGLRVRGVRECGDLLLTIQYGVCGDEVEGFLYDPTTRTFNNFVKCCSSFTYVESLFSVTRSKDA